jgi:hypothetical protein
VNDIRCPLCGAGTQIQVSQNGETIHGWFLLPHKARDKWCNGGGPDGLHAIQAQCHHARVAAFSANATRVLIALGVVDPGPTTTLH